jgi:hypothetical protein
MGAVDTIITKAGPGTIAEALISGLPILLNGNVPCQVRPQARSSSTLQTVPQQQQLPWHQATYHVTAAAVQRH